MKTYYLYAKKPLVGSKIEIGISDHRNTGDVLLTIEAESYAAACEKVSFSLTGMGKTGVLQLVNGEPRAEVI